MENKKSSPELGGHEQEIREESFFESDMDSEIARNNIFGLDTNSSPDADGIHTSDSESVTSMIFNARNDSDTNSDTRSSTFSEDVNIVFAFGFDMDSDRINNSDTETESDTNSDTDSAIDSVTSSDTNSDIESDSN